MKKVIIFVFTILAIFTLCSCRKTEEINIDYQYENIEISDGKISFNLFYNGEIVKENLDITIFTDIENSKVSSQKIKYDNGYTIDISKTEKGQTYIMKTEYTKGYNTELMFKDENVYLTKNTISYVAQNLTNEEIASLLVGSYEKTDLSKYSGYTTAIERFNIPSIVLNDGPQGIRLDDNAVWYPSGSLVASTWDEEIIYNVGKSIGLDARNLGVDVVLGPGMNIQRIATCGRNFEYYSEDPLLTGIMAAKYNDGVRTTGTQTSLKHYAVNNQETNRATISAEVTERALRDIYLKAFRIAILNSYPTTIMSSYNKVNGVYSSVSTPLLSILREDFGYSGIIMSDWDSYGDSDEKVIAGNELSMPGNESEYKDVLYALNNTKISRETAVNSIINLLTIITESNSYKNMREGKTLADYEASIKSIQEENRETALEAAESGMVLLKNEDNALPISTDKKITLLGNAAYNTIYGGDGSGTVFVSEKTSIYKGLSEKGYKLNYDTVSYFENNRNNLKNFDNLMDMEMSTNPDAAIIVIGRTCSEGADLSNIKGEFLLTDLEEELIEKTTSLFHKQNKKVIVILNTGNPIETKSWIDKVDAVLWSGLPGETAGKAVANIISGDKNPEGKLTITWPESLSKTPYGENFTGNGKVSKYNDDIYVGYRFYETFNVDCSFCFGYGLSYTNFEYSDFKLSYKTDSIIEFSVNVKNTGNVEGREIVELYANKPSKNNLENPSKELIGFTKTPKILPGKSKTVTIKVKLEYLESFIEEDSAYEIVGGTYTFYVGKSVKDIQGELIYTLNKYNTISNTIDFPDPTVKLNLLNQKDGFTEKVKKESICKDAVTYCSGKEGDEYASKFAVDGDPNTRWSGLGSSGNRWIVIDLGEVKKLSGISIYWESNSASKYTIYYSSDNNVLGGREGTSTLPTGIFWEEYQTVDLSIDDGDISLDGIEARFIKIEVPKTSQWCSIYEININ